MRFLKLALKVLALPLIIVLRAIQWIGTFFLSMSGWIFNLIASLLFILDIVCVAFGKAGRQEAVWLMAFSFAIFMLPVISRRCVTHIATAGVKLTDFVHS